MNERKAVTRETRGEYLKADKKQKGLILDQYVRLTGYNRKYAIRVLSAPPDKARMFGGRPEKIDEESRRMRGASSFPHLYQKKAQTRRRAAITSLV
jgi:hypothetical protein